MQVLQDYVQHDRLSEILRQRQTVILQTMLGAVIQIPDEIVMQASQIILHLHHHHQGDCHVSYEIPVLQRLDYRIER